MEWTFMAASAGAAYFMYFLVNAVFSPSISIKRRLEQVEDFYGEQYEVEDVRQLPFRQRVVEPFQLKLKTGVSKKTPKGMLEQLELKVERAGNPYALGATGWIVVRLVFVAAIPVITALWILQSDNTMFMKPLIIAFSFVFAWHLPNLILDSNIKKRRKILTRQLPDALDILTVSVESGLSFDSAVVKLVEKSRSDLAREFEKVLAEVQLGKTRRDALKNMAQRCDADDVKVFISAIIQAEQLGVSIGRVLRIQASQIRTKRRQRAEELAIKAPVKMIPPLVFFVFPGLFIVILGPAFIQIKNYFLSR